MRSGRSTIITINVSSRSTFYFQCLTQTDNPSKPVADNQHWGHATSSDLYHWTNHPPAITPDSEGYIFSGSAVIDSANTSGFFPDHDDGVVAIYTAHTSTKETQHIAYSTDSGYTFTKYANNPVIDSHTDDFRDPKVFWHARTQQWAMVIAWAHDRKIGIFTSPNLKDWTPTSNYTQPGLPGEEFECPNLVTFAVDPATSDENTKDVLFISVNPGAPLGGSGTFYVVGDFNGTHFNSEVEQSTLYDFAKDNYASQWFYDLPEDSRPVSIGWASNWDYAEEVPTDREGWRSAATLPREHTLKNIHGAWTVTQTPFQSLSSIKNSKLADKTLTDGDVSIDFSNITSNAISFAVTLNGLPSNPTGDLTFNFTSSISGEYLDGGVHLDEHFFWINRAGTHLFTETNNADFTPDFNTTIPAYESGHFAFSGVIDRSIFEVFLGDEGEQSGTMSFFPTSPLDRLTVSAGSLGERGSVHVEAWVLESGWSS